MANGNLQFGINFKVDKSGLTQALRPLQQIAEQTAKLDKQNGTKNLTEDMKRAASTAKELQKIINGSWNDKLNQLNLNKFSTSIKQTYGSVQNLRERFVKLGPDGEKAFIQVASQVLNTSTQLRNTSKWMDKLAQSMANTVRWQISSKVFNTITGSIQQAYYYTKDLDKALTSIRVVTGESADQMERFADLANQASKNLGRSTLDYTKAALGYYQQGLDTQQVQARTEVTLKAENITGAGSQMVDYLTSVWNGFQIDTSSIQDAEAAVDKMAAVADSSASNMSQLALAMSKVAATANLMGVDMDSLIAQLATVIATTRQAPEAVGTAFKTIYTRLNDIKTGADDAQISLGNYSGQMASLGFNVLDANGKLRDTGETIEEIGSRWNTLSKEQQTYLARIMGGQRQITQVIALFDNWTKYSDLLNTSLEAQGTLDEKNAVYLESLQGHLQKLGTEAERFYQIIGDSGALKGVVDGLNSILTIFNNFISGLGGGGKTILAFGSIVASVFQKQIANQILKAQESFQKFANNFRGQKFKESLVKDINAFQGQTVESEILKTQTQKMSGLFKIQKDLTNEEFQTGNAAARHLAVIQQEVRQREQELVTLKQHATEVSNYSKLQQQILDKVTTKGRSQAETEIRLQQERKSLQNQFNLYSSIDTVKKGINQLSTLELSDKARATQLTQLLKQHENDILTYLQQQGKKRQDARKIYQRWISDSKNFEKVQGSTNSLLGGVEEKVKNTEAHLQATVSIQQKRKDKTQEQIQAEEIALALARQQKEQEEQKLRVLEKQAQQRRNTQIAVAAITGITTATTSIIGFFDVVNDKLKTAEDKANSLGSMITSLGFAASGIATAIGGPIAGAIVTSVSTIIGTIIKNVTTGWFQTVQEKIEKFEQKADQVQKNYTKNAKNIGTIQGLAKQWEYLSDKAGEYGRTIDNLTEEEKDRYYEILDTFQEYNNQAIIGYNAQGDAIASKNDLIKQTIKLLEQEQYKNLLDNESLSSFYQGKKQQKTNYQAGRQAKDQFIEQFGQQSFSEFLENNFWYRNSQGLPAGIANSFLNDLGKFYESDNFGQLYLKNLSDEDFYDLIKTITEVSEKYIDSDGKSAVNYSDMNYDLSNYLSNYGKYAQELIKGFDQISAYDAALITKWSQSSSFGQKYRNLSFESMSLVDIFLQEYFQKKIKEDPEKDPETLVNESDEFLTKMFSYLQQTGLGIDTFLQEYQNYQKKMELAGEEINLEDFLLKYIWPKMESSFYKQTPEVQAQIQNLFANLLGASEIDFSEATINATGVPKIRYIEEDQFEEAYKDQLKKKSKVYNFDIGNLEQVGFSGITNAKGKDLFQLLQDRGFDLSDLSDFDKYWNLVDWESLVNIPEEELADTLVDAFVEAKKEYENFANANPIYLLSPDSLIAGEDLANTLSSSKDLNKNERELYDALIAKDEVLAEIVHKHGERNTQAIKRVKEITQGTLDEYITWWSEQSKKLEEQGSDKTVGKNLRDILNIFDDTGHTNFSKVKKDLRKNGIDDEQIDEFKHALGTGDIDTVSKFLTNPTIEWSDEVQPIIDQLLQAIQDGASAEQLSAKYADMAAQAAAKRRQQQEAITKAAKDQAKAIEEGAKKREAEDRKQTRTEAISARDALLTGQEKIGEKDFKITSADSDWVYTLVDNNDDLAILAKESGGIYSQAFLEGLQAWFSNSANIQKAFEDFNTIVEGTLNDDYNAAVEERDNFEKEWYTEESINKRLKDANTSYTYEDYEEAKEAESSGWKDLSEDDQKRYEEIITLAEKRSEYESEYAAKQEKVKEAEEAIEENTRKTSQNQQKSLEAKQKQTIEDLKQLQAQRDKKHQENLKNNAKDRQNLKKQEEALEKVGDLYKKYLDPDQFLEQSDYQSLDYLRALFTEQELADIAEEGEQYGSKFWEAVKRVSENSAAQLQEVNQKYLDSLQADVLEYQKQYGEKRITFQAENLAEKNLTLADLAWANGQGQIENKDYADYIISIAKITEDQQKELDDIEKKRLETEEKITEETRDQGAEAAARAEAEKQAAAARQKALDEQAEKRRKNKRQQDANLKKSLEGVRKQYNILSGLEQGQVDMNLLTTLQKQYPTLAAAAKTQGSRSGQKYLNAFLEVVNKAPGEIANIIGRTQESLQTEIDNAKKTRDQNLQGNTFYSADQINSAYAIVSNQKLKDSPIYKNAEAIINSLDSTVLTTFLADQEEVNQKVEDLNNYKNQQININTALLKQEKQMYSLELALSGTQIVSEKLRNQKALTKEQDLFLDKLEEEDEALKNLADTQDRYSTAYIAALRELGDEAAKIYKDQLQSNVAIADSAVAIAKNGVNDVISDILGGKDQEKISLLEAADIIDLDSLQEAYKNASIKGEALLIPKELFDSYEAFLQSQENLNDAERQSVNFDRQQAESKRELAKAVQQANRAREEYNRTVAAEERKEQRSVDEKARDALLTGQTKVFEADFKITSDNDDWVRDLLEGMDENDPLVQAAGEDFANIYSQAFYLELLNFFSNDSRFSGLLDALNNSITESLNEDVASNQQAFNDKIIQLNSPKKAGERLANNTENKYGQEDYINAIGYAFQNEDLKKLTFQYRSRGITKEDFLSQWQNLSGDSNFGKILAEAFNYTKEEMSAIDDAMDDLQESEKAVGDETKKQAENTQVIVQSEKQITDQAKQRAQAERQAAKARAEQAMSAGQDAKSALDKMRTSKPGQYELTQDEGIALAYYEKEIPALAELERGSRQYQRVLSETLNTRTDLVEKAKEETLAILESEKAQQEIEKRNKEKELEDLREKTDYTEAKKTVQSVSSTPWERAAAEQVIAKNEAQQAQLKNDINTLDGEILEKQGQIIAVETQRVDYLGKATDKVSQFNDLMNKALTSGIQMDSSDYQQLVNLMGDLMGKHKELQYQAELLKQTWKAGTEEYAAALRTVRDVLQEDALKELREDLEDHPLPAIDILLNTDNVDSWLSDFKDFLEADKRISIFIDSNVENELAGVTAEMENIYKAASKIKENYVVAIEDLQELSNVFPGILQNYTDLKNGTIQLNQQVVQSALGTAQEMVNADADAVAQKLKIAAQQQEAKADAYGNLADTYFELATKIRTGAEITAEDRARVDEAANAIIQDNSESTTTNELKNQATMANQSKTAGDKIAKNMAEAANDMGLSFENVVTQILGWFAKLSNSAPSINGKSLLDPSTITGSSSASVSFQQRQSDYTGQQNMTAKQGENDKNNLLGGDDFLNITDEYREQYATAAEEAGKWARQQEEEGRKRAANLRDKATIVELQKGDWNKNMDRRKEGLGDQSKSSGGKNGGSGSPKSQKEKEQKKPDKKDLLEDKVNRYHDIDIQIKNITKDLQDLVKKQERLFGKALLDNLYEQLDVLDKQVDAYERKIKLAEQQKIQLQNVLAGQGVNFDEEGNITNYGDIYQQKIKQVNDAIQKYNSMSAEQQKEYKQTLEQTQKDFEKWKKNLSEYDTLQNETIPGLQQNIQQALDKKIQINISKFTMSVQIELQLGKARRQWNEFRKKVIDRVAENNFAGQNLTLQNNLSTYYHTKDNGEVGGQIASNTAQVNAIMRQLQIMKQGGTSAIYEDNYAKALEDLKKYNDELQNGLMEVEDIQKEIHQNVLSAIDAAKEGMDAVKSDMDFISNQIQHDYQLMQMIHGEDNYQMNRDFLEREEQANLKNLNNLREEKELWENLMLNSKSKLQKLDFGTVDYEQQLDKFQKYKSNYLDAVNSINEGETKGVQIAQKLYENSINQAIDKVDKELTNGKGIKRIREEWEFLNEEADRYLDKVNGMYEVNSLENSIKNAVRGYQGNIKAQQALNKLGDELLTQLREKEKLTQYDVDRANLLLEIEQKRLALQDIRNNKTQLRLRRDTQGNYSYQFTANQENTTDAQQELMKAQNDLYNLDKDAKKQEMENYIKDVQNYLNRTKQFYDNSKDYILAHEDEIKRIREHYETLITGDLQRESEIRQNLEKTNFQGLVNGYTKYGESMEAATKKAKDEMSIQDNNSVPATWELGLKDMKEKLIEEGGLKNTTEQVFSHDLPAAVEDFGKSIQRVEEAAGVSFDDIKNGGSDVIPTLEEILDFDKELDDKNRDLMTSTEDLAEAAKKMMQRYQDVADAAKQAAAAAWDYWEREKQIAADDSAKEVTGENNREQKNDRDWDTNLLEGNKFNMSETLPAQSGKQKKIDVVEEYEEEAPKEDLAEKVAQDIFVWDDSVQRTGWNYETWPGGLIDRKLGAGMGAKVQSYLNQYMAKQGTGEAAVDPSLWESLKKYHASHFLSGGYTGDWAGSNGRLAMLHQKELVLNASDTQNILAAVDIARTISGLLQTISSDTGIKGLVNIFKSQGQATSQLDQNVKIEAHFPNVVNSNEIERAFDNLVNQASQYAFSKAMNRNSINNF